MLWPCKVIFRLTLGNIKIYKIASTRNEISFLQIMSHLDLQIKMGVKIGLKWIKARGSNMSAWPKGQPCRSVVVLLYAGDCVVCSALRWRCTVVSSGQFSRCASYSQHSLRSTATITISHSMLSGDVNIGILYGIPGVKLYQSVLWSIYFIITYIYIIHTSLLASLTTCVQPVKYIQCWFTLDDNTALEISEVWSLQKEE